MTPRDAASWMRQKAEQEGCLYQSEAAAYLQERDEVLAHWDDAGNLCISKAVLRAFSVLTPDYVYIRSEKFWRPREEYDLPGRQQ
jgi:hypothetical protein